jgi:hypothetical protein
MRGSHPAALPVPAAKNCREEVLTLGRDEKLIKLDWPFISVLDPGSGCGSRGAKMAQKNIKQLINFIFLSAGCSLLRAEGFS